MSASIREWASCALTLVSVLAALRIAWVTAAGNDSREVDYVGGALAGSLHLVRYVVQLREEVAAGSFPDFIPERGVSSVPRPDGHGF